MPLLVGSHFLPPLHWPDLKTCTHYSERRVSDFSREPWFEITRECNVIQVGSKVISMLLLCNFCLENMPKKWIDNQENIIIFYIKWCSFCAAKNIICLYQSFYWMKNVKNAIMMHLNIFNVKQAELFFYKIFLKNKTNNCLGHLAIFNLLKILHSRRGNILSLVCLCVCHFVCVWHSMGCFFM